MLYVASRTYVCHSHKWHQCMLYVASRTYVSHITRSTAIVPSCYKNDVVVGCKKAVIVGCKKAVIVPSCCKNAVIVGCKKPVIVGCKKAAAPILAIHQGSGHCG